MRFVLTYHHREAAWMDAAGLPVPPLGVGARASSWSIRPGKYLPAIRKRMDGVIDHGTAFWSPARPMLWDIDARAVAVSRAAVFASGFYIDTGDRWRYFAAPGEEPFFLAAAGGQKSAALLGWAPGGQAGGLPALVLGEDVVRWVGEDGTALDAFRSLRRWPADAFRSWPVQSPIDRPPQREGDDASLLEPLLDPPNGRTHPLYRRRSKIR
ncbi:hypothetical protein ACQHIH_21330 (plasmid) [Xanthomonas sontii]|uniref:hypothetical protein n=1 Tax=Xanthomonas sontii TaxID=2650745 RepID=UPI003F867341